MYSFTFTITITFIYIYKLFTFLKVISHSFATLIIPPSRHDRLFQFKIIILGFDLSTQQLKIIITDENLTPLDTYNVEFDSQFKSKYTKSIRE